MSVLARIARPVPDQRLSMTGLLGLERLGGSGSQTRRGLGEGRMKACIANLSKPALAFILVVGLTAAGCCTGESRVAETAPPLADVPESLQDVLRERLAPWDDLGFAELAGTTDFARVDSLTNFASQHAEWLRGRRYYEWADRIILSPNPHDYAATVSTVYYWAIAVSDNAPVHVVEEVYRPLLIDRDPEVRHLAAHTLIIAYVRHGQKASRKATDVRAFCAADESSTVRTLARDEHPAWHLHRRGG
jgi:hypothetical protein